jgi:hypothetical protein
MLQGAQRTHVVNMRKSAGFVAKIKREGADLTPSRQIKSFNLRCLSPASSDCLMVLGRRGVGIIFNIPTGYQQAEVGCCEYVAA